MESTEEKIEEVLLVASMDDILISQVCAVLEENNIPFIKVDEGSGSYMNIYMGFSNQEKKIIVSKENYDKAGELISPLLTTKEEEGLEDEELPEELKEDNTEDENMNAENSQKAHAMLRHILGFLVLVVPTIIVLIVLIASNIMNLKK